MKKWLLIAVLSIGVLGKMYAQYDAHFTHYWKMHNFYNPAGAGFEKEMAIYAAYSNQMTGFEGNPKTMLINIDAPIPFIKSDHNLGLGILNDDIGLFSNQRLYLNYAYGFKLFKGRFAIGIQAGLVNSSFESKDIDFGGESNDPAFPSGNADGNNLDLGAGIPAQIFPCRSIGIPP